MSDREIEKQILGNLRGFHPIRVDEAVLIFAVQKSNKDVSTEQISKTIRSLRDKGWIEESLIKVPFGKTETYRFKITSSGIEQLQSMDIDGKLYFSIALAKLESRLVETSGRIDGDMGNLRIELNERIDNLDGAIEELRKELVAVKGLVAKYADKAEADVIREERLILRILSGDERTVYDLILGAGGEILQKDLVVRCKMSNSKVSRIVDHLGSRGVLSKERYGATNRIRINVNPPKS